MIVSRKWIGKLLELVLYTRSYLTEVHISWSRNLWAKMYLMEIEIALIDLIDLDI